MKIGRIEVKDEVFNVEVKKHVLWEVVKWQLASRRQGTHSTKSRSDMNYSSRKLLPQKGTGNARHGDRSANILVGGAVAHGPKPRDYSYNLPKKVRKLGLKMALSDKAKNKNIIIVEKIDIGDTPKTKKALEFLKKKKIEGVKVLIVTPKKEEVLIKSFRNLPNAKVLPVEGLNVYDILWSDKLVILKSALEGIYERVER